MRTLFIVLLFFSLSGCEILSSRSGQFDAQLTPSSLMLENNMSETVYYFAIGRDVSARSYWVPRFNGSNALREGATRSIPRDAIIQDDNERELIVYWWTTLDKQALQKEGAVRTIIVTLE